MEVRVEIIEILTSMTGMHKGRVSNYDWNLKISAFTLHWQSNGPNRRFSADQKERMIGLGEIVWCSPRTLVVAERVNKG